MVKADYGSKQLTKIKVAKWGTPKKYLKKEKILNVILVKQMTIVVSIGI